MKTGAIAILVCAAAVLLGLFLMREHQPAREVVNVDELKDARTEHGVRSEMLAAQIRSLEERNAALEAERNALTRNIAEMKRRIAAAGTAEETLATPASTAPDETAASADAAAVAEAPAGELADEAAEEPGKAAEAGSFGRMLSGMMKDPKMKEMMRSQQEMGITMMYGDLVTELGLSEEDGAALKKLLIDRQMSVMELSITLMDTTADEAEREEAPAKIKTETEKYEEQIKAFLGEDRFAQYETYNKSLQERMTLGQFKRQTQYLDTALSDLQYTQMMDAMKEEREAFSFTRNLGNNREFDPSVFQEKVMETYFREKEQLDGRILTRASGILTPAQYDAFKTFQTNQRATQKMSMEMAKKMFPEKKDAQEE